MARAVKEAAPVAKPTRKPAAAVNTYDEELAKFAQEYASMEANSTGALPFISFKGGRISFKGGEVPGNTMNVVVLDHILENHYYTEAFDSENPTSPVCFAFAAKDEELAPHENSSEPQNEACKGCPMNEFGSADRGKGKACKNIRRLAVLTEDAIEDADEVADAEVSYIKVPVMSVKAWAGYVQQLAGVMGLPPFAALTEVSLVPDAKSTFRVQFKLVETITDKAIIKALIAKRETIQQELRTPYQAVEAAPEEEKPARGRQKAAAKPTKPAAKPARGGRKF